MKQLPLALFALISMSLVLFQGCQQNEEKSEPIAIQEPAPMVSESEFAKNTIQIGLIVSDLEISLYFYTNVIGMVKNGRI